MKTKCLESFAGIEHISFGTIDEALREFHYSFKMITLVPEARNTNDVINKRFQYAVKYNEMMIEKQKMFFIDECGIQIWSRRSSGRAVKGLNAFKRVKAIRSMNYSVCAAMNEKSLFFFEIQDMPYNSEHYFGFLAQLFNHLNLNGITGAYLVMDNVPFHHTQEVKNLIEAHNHNVVFLPPYSPFLNPIEEVFSKWKTNIRGVNRQTKNNCMKRCIAHRRTSHLIIA